MKITNKDGSKIKIPYCTTDIERFRTIFKPRKNNEIKEMHGGALLRQRGLHIMIPIRSNGIKILKYSIVQRFSKHFHPARETASISVGIIDGVNICCEIEEGKDVQYPVAKILKRH